MGDGAMIVMTDLFLSATAVLLVVIALSEPDQPSDVPIQADLVALCPATVTPAGVPQLLAVRDLSRLEVGPAEEVNRVPISVHEDLPEALAALADNGAPGVEGAALLRIALVDFPGHPMTAPCFRVLAVDVVEAYNRWLQGLDEKPGLPALSLALSGHGLALPETGSDSDG